MSLPNPAMSFSPFAILTSEEMNQIVENIEALSDGSGLADGSITNAKLSASAGELGGAWSSWPLTWTNLTPGDGTNNSKRMQIGKTVFFKVEFTLGTTSSVGTNPYINFPVAPVTLPQLAEIGVGSITDISAPAAYSLAIIVEDATKMQLVARSGGGYTNITATVPFIWSTGDRISAHGFYEAL